VLSCQQAPEYLDPALLFLGTGLQFGDWASVRRGTGFGDVASHIMSTL
jgi:hypothetical protein